MAFGVNLTGCPWSNAGAVLQSASTAVRNESVAEALDERGNTAARTYYGGDSGVKTVTATFALKSGTLSGTVDIGKTSGIESFKVTTSNGDWPKIEVAYHEGGPAATGDDFTVTLPSVEALRVAQPLGVTVGSGAKLSGSEATWKCDFSELLDDHGELAATAFSHGTFEITAEAVAVTASPVFSASSATMEEIGGLEETNTGYGTSSAKASGFLTAKAAA